jgi:hypothetical protein
MHLKFSKVKDSRIFKSHSKHFKMKKIYFTLFGSFLIMSSFAQIEVFSGGAVSVGSTSTPTSGYEMQLTGKSLFSSNVGIGNTSPAALLDVGTYTGTTYGRFSAAQIGYIGQSGAGFCFNGNSYTAYALLQTSTNTYLNCQCGYSIVFRYCNTNLGTWNSTGLGVGAVTPSHLLQLSGDDAAKPTTSTWIITSDSRTKTNVVAYKHGLDLLRKVKIISYQYNGVANTPLGEKGIGVIAQDFQNVFPSSVKPFTIKADSVNEGGTFLGVNLHELFVSNVVAVQQLDSIVAAQAATIMKQDSINKALQEQITRIVNTCCPAATGRMMQSNSNTQTNGLGTINIKLSDVNSIVLNQNAPNPFAEQTLITYNIPQITNSAQILFYNAAGVMIKSADIKTTGPGQLNVYANDLSNGIYSYTLVVDGKIIDTKRMVKQQ